MSGRTKLALRMFITALVIWGISRAAQRAVRDVGEQNRQLDAQLAELDRQLEAADPRNRAPLLAERAVAAQSRLVWSAIRVRWLAASAACCLVGLLPCWWFWHRAMQAMGQRPPPLRSLAAYYIGHLGKYIPGKALVVVLRASLVSGPDVRWGVAVAAVFVETLTTMAVGAAVAAGILLAISQQAWLLALSIGLLAAAGVPTLPPVFRRVVRFLQARRAAPMIEEAVAGLTWRLMARGWLLSAAAWGIQGASLWCALRATPGVDPQLHQLPLVIACLALAVVAGFLSLIPGGLGIRELVITELLAPEFSTAGALGAAVLLRIAWLVAELLISAILYLAVARRRPENPTATLSPNSPPL